MRRRRSQAPVHSSSAVPSLVARSKSGPWTRGLVRGDILHGYIDGRRIESHEHLARGDGAFRRSEVRAYPALLNGHGPEAALFKVVRTRARVGVGGGRPRNLGGRVPRKGRFVHEDP